MRQKSISSSKYFAIQHFPLEVTDIPDFILAISLLTHSFQSLTQIICVVSGGLGWREAETEKIKKQKVGGKMREKSNEFP